jgi:hypothetical protein
MQYLYLKIIKKHGRNLVKEWTIKEKILIIKKKEDIVEFC